MNWFTNFYFADGPGIAKDAPKPTGLKLLWSTFMREWWDLIKLNLLFLLAALPIITLPAAYVAMTRICAQMVDDQNVYLWRDFWTAFAQNFWRASIAGVLLAGLGSVCVLAVLTYFNGVLTDWGMIAPFAIALVMSLLVPIFGAHLLLILAQTQLALFEGIKAAIVGAVVRPWATIGGLAFVAFLWALHVMFYPVTLLMPVLFIFSFGALTLAFCARDGAKIGVDYVRSASANDQPNQLAAQLQTGGDYEVD